MLMKFTAGINISKIAKLEKQYLGLLLFLLFSGIFMVELFPLLYVTIDTQIYLTAHTVLEFLSIVVSLAVFIVARYNYQQTANPKELVICLTFFMVGVLDFAHTLSYEGMPNFITANSVNKASLYWIIARLVEGFGLLAVVFAPNHTESRFVRPIPLLVAVSLATSLVLVMGAFYHQNWPQMFIPGHGQTPLKIGLEYVVIVFKAVSLGILFRSREKRTDDYYLEAAFIFGIFAEIAFTQYSSAYDTYNMIGHIYKIGAFAYILRGLFVSSVVRLYETNRILTDQKRLLADANERLAKADRLKSEFLANTNHELRTPLTAILAFTELLLDEDTGRLNDTQRDYINEIYDSGQHLLNDINNLLDLSKIESGKMELKPERSDVYEIISQLARKFVPVFKQKKQEFIYTIEDNIPPVSLDGDKIRKILQNLINNAYKFTGEGGCIRLEISFLPDEESLLFSVSDNGIGIHPDDQTVIFEKFRQVDGSATRIYHGTGLGLTLVKYLVELHGGQIWLQSAPGRGSVFSFTVKTNMSREVG